MSDPAEIQAAESQQSLRQVTPELVESIAVAMREGRAYDVRHLVGPLTPPDMAWVLEQLSEEERQNLLDLIKTDLDPEVLVELDESVRDSVIEHLGHKNVALAAAELDSDDAVDIIGDLDEADREQVLAAMPAEDRAEIEQALSYDEDTAGRMMQRELVAVPQKWSVGEVIDYLRESADELPEDFYDVIVVDDENRPVGTVALGTLVRTKRPVLVADIKDANLRTLPVSTAQEEVAHLFRDHNLVSAPVIDADGKLVGVITVDDVVDVIGMDVYAEEWNDVNADPVQRFRSYVEQPFGLKWHRDFARERGKPISYPEWGVGDKPGGHGVGDDPVFIAGMADWFEEAKPLYQSYWDVRASDYNARMSDFQFPAAAEMFQRRFGAAAVHSGN